jgi:hypothetical protein
MDGASQERWDAAVAVMTPAACKRMGTWLRGPEGFNFSIDSDPSDDADATEWDGDRTDRCTMCCLRVNGAEVDASPALVAEPGGGNACGELTKRGWPDKVGAALQPLSVAVASRPITSPELA